MASLNNEFISLKEVAIIPDRAHIAIGGFTVSRNWLRAKEFGAYIRG